MSKLFSYRETKRYSNFPEKNISVEQARRQRILSREPLNWLILKDYPCIFLDRRLRSRLFR